MTDIVEFEKNVTRKKRPVGNPALNGADLNITPTENAKLIKQGMTLLNMPNIDLHDPVAVQNRINEYLTIVAQNGNKPTVSGLGLALNGMSRQDLWEIRTGNYRNGPTKVPFGLPQEVTDLIKKTYKFMEELWENYMNSGKINPVSGIFLGKNHFGYQDKQDIVVTPNNPEQDYNAADIAQRYVTETEKDEQ